VDVAHEEKLLVCRAQKSFQFRVYPDRQSVVLAHAPIPDRYGARRAVGREQRQGPLQEMNSCIAVLTAEARNQLEQEAPVLALQLDRYIMDCPA
jgi:hypothetical protein